MTTKRPRPAARHNPGHLAADRLPDLASIVCDLRPGWDRGLVLSILTGHRSSVTGATLVRAAVDAADDPDVVDPRAIAWSLRRAEHAPLPVCAVCNKTADQCARRVGIDDDHDFIDKANLSPVERPGWQHTCQPPGHSPGVSAIVRLPDSFTACRVCGVVRS